MGEERAAPEACGDLDDIRTGMDAIDREVIRLIAERVGYVRAAAKFKTSSANVAAPDRVAAVLRTRREWAEEAGLDGPFIEDVYVKLVTYCVSEEHKRWHELNPQA